VGKFIDRTNLRYGKLVCKQYLGDGKWLCECDCGNKNVVVNGYSLSTGHTKSCGCYNKEIHAQIAKTLFKKYNQYDLSGEVGIGYAHNTNKPFYFDKEDYDLIKEYCWSELKNGYIQANNDGKKIYLHRLITNPNANEVVDHIDHNPLNNLKTNLRICTQQQNTHNSSTPITNTSGIKGVSWDKNMNKWFAYIGYNNKRISLGYYDDIKEAEKARKEANIKYYGEYRNKGEERQCD
jgi:hypothetical protein